MTDAAILVALMTTSGVLALNLFLTLRLAGGPMNTGEGALSPGDRLPPVSARKNGAALDWDNLTASPFVLTFLSAHCPSCRQMLPRLKTAAMAANTAGVPVHVIPVEDGDALDRLVETAGLRENLLALDASSRRRLNPMNATPYYMFVRQAGVVEAVGYIGDADWEAFEHQVSSGA